jgi:hypothetical protein
MAESPSTHATLTVQVGSGRFPTIEATAAVMPSGEESVFAVLRVDSLTHGQPERHTAQFTLIGPRGLLLDVLAQLSGKVVAAQPAE